jgi:Methylase involved in ubiquinone/menaquinone biosynthesis
LLNSEYLGDNKKVLDFSPSRSLYRKLKKYPGIHYFSTDRSGDFISDFQYDITSIDVETATFDIIICYHILEHVIDDRRAMQELFRVLKDDGICIIQAPFKEGEIYENWTVKTDDERLAHFGQRDHVRIYSVDGLRIRLSDAGFHVIIREFEAPERNKHGFSSHETVLLCTKSRL